MRLFLAFACFFRVLFGKPLPAELLPAPAALPASTPAPAAAPAATPAPAAAKKEDKGGTAVEQGALQVLALLQREGRLIDFLREGIDAYDDAAVGSAVRDIHRGCKKAIDAHFTIEPVMGGAENEKVTVDAGFDAARIRLVGNVAGAPPFRGTLRHHGWIAAKVKLPERTATLDARILAPAEVEV